MWDVFFPYRFISFPLSMSHLLSSHLSLHSCIYPIFLSKDLWRTSLWRRVSRMLHKTQSGQRCSNMVLSTYMKYPCMHISVCKVHCAQLVAFTAGHWQGKASGAYRVQVADLSLQTNMSWQKELLWEQVCSGSHCGSERVVIDGGLIRDRTVFWFAGVRGNKGDTWLQLTLLSYVTEAPASQVWGSKLSPHEEKIHFRRKVPANQSKKPNVAYPYFLTPWLYRSGKSLVMLIMCLPSLSVKGILFPLMVIHIKIS